MNRTEKQKAINLLKKRFKRNNFFYLTDSSQMSVADVNDLRRKCRQQGVEMKVVKNKLAIKALETFAEDRGFIKLYDLLKGPTAIMFSESASVPARIIKEFRKTHERPILKAAYIDVDVYVGDDQVDALCNLKSKEDLVGEVIGMLEGSVTSVISALDGGATIASLLTALEER